jgi:hypothetical protein
LFLPDFSPKQIADVVESCDSDIRSALNNLHFSYAPIMMKPLYKKQLTEELLSIEPPTIKLPKVIKNTRYLAELAFDLHRSGLMKSSESEGFG